MSEKSFTDSRAFRWGRDILLFAVVFGAVMVFQTWNHVGSGAMAPAFDLPRLDDSSQRVSTDTLKGKPTLVYFWAPWCGVCEASSHNVESVHRAVGDDYNVVAVALEYADVPAVRGFIERNEASYPVLLGSRNETRNYSVEAFPTIYVLDSEGHVAASVVGYTTEIGLRLRLWWASLS